MSKLNGFDYAHHCPERSRTDKTKQTKIQKKVLSQSHHSDVIYWMRHFGKRIFPTFISSFTLHKHVVENAYKYTLFIMVCLLLFFNIFLSLFISPLYYQLMNENKKAAVSYVRSLRDFDSFSFELLKFKDIYGKGFENDVFAQEIKENIMIQNLERILNKNPYSKDVLYSLYLLYNDKGDKIMAEKYLRRAKEVDPNITTDFH